MKILTFKNIRTKQIVKYIVQFLMIFFKLESVCCRHTKTFYTNEIYCLWFVCLFASILAFNIEPPK